MSNFAFSNPFRYKPDEQNPNIPKIDGIRDTEFSQYAGGFLVVTLNCFRGKFWVVEVFFKGIAKTRVFRLRTRIAPLVMQATQFQVNQADRMKGVSRDIQSITFGFEKNSIVQILDY